MSNTKERTWGNYRLEVRTEYGYAAHKNRGNFSGQKIHRLRCEYIIGVIDEAAERLGTMGQRFLNNGRKPVLFSCSPICGCTNGQNAGKPSPTKTATDVTCTKCEPSLKSEPVWTVSWCYRNDRTKTFKVSGDMKSTAELFDLIKVIENVQCTIERTSPK